MTLLFKVTIIAIIDVSPVTGTPRAIPSWEMALGRGTKSTSPMVFAVLATHLVSGRHSSQGEARSAIEPTLTSPAPNEFLVLNAPKILSTTKLSIAFLTLKTEMRVLLPMLP